MASKRKLPVLQNRPGEEANDPPRPQWQWVGFGAAATLAAWLPLSLLAAWVARRLSPAFLQDVTNPEELERALGLLTREERIRLWTVQLLPPIVALAIASVFGGFLVGRFSPERSVYHPPLAAMACAAVAVLLTCKQGYLSWTFGVVLLLAAVFGYVGGRVGIAKRSAN